MAKEETQEEDREFYVVSQLPQQPARVGINEKGTEVDLIPIEEALTEILEKIREIHVRVKKIA